ncbi:hypothetical protein AB0D98_16945 [Streptomyces sp. NPDC047987]|uniref:hypothetical protein n=1 Tax=unclassified Streptomyces TaxID=2593676 RepID=UPI003439AF1B
MGHSLEVLRFLVGHGARLDMPRHPARGDPFAHHSSTAQSVYAFLLDHGAPVDVIDIHGSTPLHDAVLRARPRPVDLLPARGADTRAVGHLGRTPPGTALRLPGFGTAQRNARKEITTMLENAGAPAHVGHPVTEGGPLPIDMAAVRRVAEATRARLSEACRAAGIPDDSAWLAERVRPEYESYQAFVAELRHDCDPDHVPFLPKLCAEALGDDARTNRSLIGDQEVGEPFFHHGDLIVKGHLDVMAPFVVTGSLTVDGCMEDCGPDSVVAVDGDVTARAVHTDGEMYVGGDIEARVVYGCSNDNTLQARTIRARLVIEDEHCTVAEVEAETHFDLDDFQQGYGDGVQERLRELLVDEVFSNEEDEEMLDRTLLFARLREGEKVFRADGAASD